MTEEMKEILDTIQESYKQGYEDAINKACEWLEKNFNMPNDFQKHFRKAMEK